MAIIPTTTSIVDLSVLSPYAAPVYHPFSQERAHLTSLSNRRHRRDYTENPPTEEEIKRAQEQIERARHLRELLKNPPVEGSGQDNIGKDIK